MASIKKVEEARENSSLYDEDDQEESPEAVLKRLRAQDINTLTAKEVALIRQADGYRYVSSPRGGYWDTDDENKEAITLTEKERAYYQSKAERDALNSSDPVTRDRARRKLDEKRREEYKKNRQKQ